METRSSILTLIRGTDTAGAWIKNELNDIKSAVTSKLDLICASSRFAVPLSAILAILITWSWYLSQDGSGQGEPFSCFNGASAWPSLAITIFASLLSIHFIFKTHVGLRQNAKKLTKRFVLGDFKTFQRDPPLFSWRNTALEKSENDETAEVEMVVLWRRYLRLGRLQSRLQRCVPMAFLYLLAISVIAPVLGRPPIPPIRGDFPYLELIWCAVFAFVLLTFCVIDAILLHEGFLRQLTAGKMTVWPQDTGKRLKYTPETLTVHSDDLADYWDILLIAKRTKAVGNKIYYPFIILSLLIVARLNYFDNWDWSPVLVIVFCSHFCLAFFAAWRLPKMARDYRDKVLERLKRRRRQVLMRADKTPEAVDTIVEEIEATHQGAFSYLWEQPVVRAALLPSSGLGLITILQYFSH